MTWEYTCDCKSRGSAPVLKPVPVTNQICNYCGHYAFLCKIKSGRVFIHDMYPKGKSIDQRLALNEDFMYE